MKAPLGLIPFSSTSSQWQWTCEMLIVKEANKDGESGEEEPGTSGQIEVEP